MRQNRIPPVYQILPTSVKAYKTAHVSLDASLTMFKKALVHQSNATPIRSSACRQLLNRILDQYPALRPPTHEDPEASSSHDQNAKAGSSKELGKVILPDGVKSGTFETSQGVEGVSSCSDGLS